MNLSQVKHPRGPPTLIAEYFTLYKD